MKKERRIYVVIAAKVTGALGEVLQPLGRQAAQACHVVSLMRVMKAIAPLLRMGKGDKKFDSSAIEPITTILLQARDSKELEHVRRLLDAEVIPYNIFSDTNEQYGKDADGKLLEVHTALSTHPVEPVDVAGILDYLPLWGK